MTAARFDWSPLRAGDVHSVAFSFVDSDRQPVTMASEYFAEVRDDWYPKGLVLAEPSVAVDTSTITLILDATQTTALARPQLKRLPYTLRDTVGETTLIEGYVTVRTQGGTSPAGQSVVVMTEPTIEVITPPVPIGSPGPSGADGAEGPAGDDGIVVSDTPPENTDILWADTTIEGAAGQDTVSVFTYTDETDTRPLATVVFWIPDPYDLPDPIDAEVGDLVLRTTPNVVTGTTGIDGIWTGTAAEYEALGSYDDNTLYFIVPTP